MGDKLEFLSVGELAVLADNGLLKQRGNYKYFTSSEHDCDNEWLRDHYGTNSMPEDMVEECAGKTVECEPINDNQWRLHSWYTVEKWMLKENFGEILDHYGIKKTQVKILTDRHLEALVEAGVVNDEYGDEYNCGLLGGNCIPYNDEYDMYSDVIDKFIIVEFNSCGDMTYDTPDHKWSITPWMLDLNYDTLMGYPDDSDKDADWKPAPRNEVNIAGEIVNRYDDNSFRVEIEKGLSVIVFGYVDEHCKKAAVKGKLKRGDNMMGYPEVVAENILSI